MVANFENKCKEANKNVALEGRAKVENNAALVAGERGHTTNHAQQLKQLRNHRVGALCKLRRRHTEVCEKHWNLVPL